ncbi:MAG TPA: DinB family protein [Beijerinckiaceae bacterium]|nr:DinB family protein [Beijerinckiaceae bacterium]
MKQNYLMFARYNRWANARLYAAAAALSDVNYRADRGAFFKSLHGTLNHMLVADRIWMRRFTGTGETVDKLNAILFDDLPALETARRAEDERIINWIDGVDEAALAGSIRYRSVSVPREYEQELAPALAHFFNHQAHHRGQAHAILTGLCGRAPELDLLIYQREAGIGARQVG